MDVTDIGYMWEMSSTFPESVSSFFFCHLVRYYTVIYLSVFKHTLSTFPLTRYENNKLSRVKWNVDGLPLTQYSFADLDHQDGPVIEDQPHVSKAKQQHTLYGLFSLCS